MFNERGDLIHIYLTYGVLSIHRPSLLCRHHIAINSKRDIPRVEITNAYTSLCAASTDREG